MSTQAVIAVSLISFAYGQGNSLCLGTDVAKHCCVYFAVSSMDFVIVYHCLLLEAAYYMLGVFISISPLTSYDEPKWHCV